MKKLCIIVSAITAIIGVMIGIIITYNLCTNVVVDFNDDVQAYQKKSLVP